MKFYLIKTNAYNEIVAVKDGKFKVSNSAPSGLFDGVVDIYTDEFYSLSSVIANLKTYFRSVEIDGNFDCLTWDEIEPFDLDGDDDTEIYFIAEVGSVTF